MSHFTLKGKSFSNLDFGNSSVWARFLKGKQGFGPEGWFITPTLTMTSYLIFSGHRFHLAFLSPYLFIVPCARPCACEMIISWLPLQSTHQHTYSIQAFWLSCTSEKHIMERKCVYSYVCVWSCARFCNTCPIFIHVNTLVCEQPGQKIVCVLLCVFEHTMLLPFLCCLYM